MQNSHEPKIIELKEDQLALVAGGTDLYVRDLVLIAAYKAGLLQQNNCADGYHHKS